ncbi:hypothetical protein SUDANB145_07379 (plasmid) [Streptomyces sp. enrichment culture]|uniref:hypothetical protein n=1 Tax=Streptomyces sp. enrichment culture TaxID=1795815 RepID=UPI003F572CD7
MLTIEVKRHAQGEGYFAPWIEDYEDGTGCTFHFHWDDISDEGVDVFREVFTEQARRWHPRRTGAQRGRRIPITMERLAVLEGGAAVVVDDRADLIAYTARADLISARGAAYITRHQSERSPHWERSPARYVVRQRASA